MASKYEHLSREELIRVLEFNPTSQGEKFDPGGEYVRRWLPELKEVEKKFIYEP